MSLMKLSPESVRLRRIAKACAAGEFSQGEYRAARREVIANFTVALVDDDDTRPRELRGRAPEGDDSSVRVSVRRRLWPVMLVILGLLVAATQALADAQAEILRPAERDPNPATSPRLAVADVRLTGARELPGLELADVEAVIAAKLSELRARQAPLDHGFTPAELDEVARLLNALGVHESGPEPTAADLAELNALIAEQKSRRGLSVLDLEEVALAVQQHYRDAGYFLAVAYLPAQVVEDDVVEINVLPGVLGDVVAEDHEPLAAGFADLIGRPVTAREISSRLYALNQAPGRTAQATFEPGSAVGETSLHLDVRTERSWHGRIALDNHGDDGTGERRVVTRGSWLNPTGRGDALELGLLASLQNADQLYGFVGYEAPLSDALLVRSRLGFNHFDTEDIATGGDVSGDGWLADVALSRHLHRDRRRSLSVDFGLGYHRLGWDDELAANLDDDTQNVYFVSSALQADRVWDTLQIAAEARLQAEFGSIEDLTFAGQDSSYGRLLLDTFAWRPLALPGLPGEQKLSFELRGQLSGSQLPSTKRMALGGHLAARGFRRDTFLVDQGAVARLDLRTPMSVGELSLFGDVGYGETQNSLDSSWGRVSSLGLAWNMRLQGVESRLSWAMPLASDGSGGLDDDGAQIFWSLSYGR